MDSPSHLASVIQLKRQKYQKVNFTVFFLYRAKFFSAHFFYISILSPSVNLQIFVIFFSKPLERGYLARVGGLPETDNLF
jgi:hypothetical protein